MGVKLGIVGLGQFSRNFIPLFKAHPLVDELVLCDLDPAKRAAACEAWKVARSEASLEDLCRTDVHAVVVMTQNWLHGPQAVQALRAGKHVYSAVPAGISLDEIGELVRAVRETGRIYMMGETSYYYPAVLYCRARHATGDFGRVVFAEAEYYHDWDHGLYAVMRARGGDRWRRTAGSPPMYYPTHSISQVLSVTGARMTSVSCLGFVDDAADGLYGRGSNDWDNPFSNETALFELSDGSSCRVNEFRRIGHHGGVRFNLFGTAGSFEMNRAGVVWLTKDRSRREDLVDLLEVRAGPGAAETTWNRHGEEGIATPRGWYRGVAPVHPVERLPVEFADLPNGHDGSHQFLVDDFITACATGTMPPVNAWAAARYTVPGIVAHESAVRGGVRMPVPDFGDPPATG
jgi:predicted dehydrogenase